MRRNKKIAKIKQKKDLNIEKYHDKRISKEISIQIKKKII